jgi:hypothetical protein
MAGKGSIRIVVLVVPHAGDTIAVGRARVSYDSFYSRVVATNLYQVPVFVVVS